MKTRQAASLLLSFAAALALGACGVAPHGRTIVLPRPEFSAAASAQPAGRLAFELVRATAIPVSIFDQAGYFGQGAQFVYGWLDDDHLAAIGTTPVDAASSPAATNSIQQKQRDQQQQAGAPQALPGNYSPISTKGIVGQILSVDWQTGKTAELHTVQDAVILAMGLSHDKTKLWYTTSDGNSPTRLSVTDATFKHDLLEFSGYFGALPVWSSGDNLLGYFTTDKINSFLTLFDGAQSSSYVVAGINYFKGQGLLGIDDDTGDVLIQQRVGGLVLMNLNRDLKKTASGSASVVSPRGIYAGLQVVAKSAGKAVFSGDLLLYLTVDSGGSQLNAIDRNTNKPVQSMDGVINFALSDDQKYICLVRQGAGSSADVSIAQWSDGKIENEKIVFRGFVADGNIFFNPDNSKLYIEGNYGFSSLNKSAMVLQFK